MKISNTHIVKGQGQDECPIFLNTSGKNQGHQCIILLRGVRFLDNRKGHNRKILAPTLGPEENQSVHALSFTR